MLGAFAAGKTSLVQQFAHGLFSERYHTTVGVRIEKKPMTIDDTNIDLLLWDLHGDDEFQRTSYLQGAFGFVYVIDGTRRETLDTMLDLKSRVDGEHAGLPAVILLNKRDERRLWELTAADTRRLSGIGDPVLEVSAKTGAGVDEAFTDLARRMLTTS